jgi:murein L,D-transpeptidase YcbB/YkuD
VRRPRHWADGNQLDFRDDIYGWDQETLQALDAATVHKT